ncbi:MAG: LTA synthase family protein [Bacillus sp. (in: firmicutes)]
MKLALRNAPITLADFSLLDELAGLADLDIPFFKIILAFIILLTGLTGIYFLPKRKEHWLIKSTLGLISVSLLLVIWFEKPVSPSAEAKLWYLRWDPERAVGENGLIANFTLVSQKSQVKAPEGYSKKAIADIIATYKPDDSSTVTASNVNMNTGLTEPNVIFLMSEAFVDPYIWGEEYFTKDPVPNFRKAYEESFHGMVYSPEFGGATANVEFEALTGLSKQFINSDIIAYNSLNMDLPSIAKVFSSSGYRTTAIHAYKSWFYQRANVYKNLGFDKFISGEFLNLDHPLNAGKGYPSDRHMTDAILTILNTNSEPAFIHAVGVEGHLPYYKNNTESEFLDSSSMNTETYGFFNTYVNRMNSVDRELGRLLEELKKLERPTIVVFWGDHYPGLPFEQVYGDSGLQLASTTNGSYEDFINIHQVPYFIWNSAGTSDEEMNITPNMFGQIVTDMANIEGNTVLEILSEMMEKADTYIPYGQYTEEMGAFTKEMQDLRLLQYDLLNGKDYYGQIAGKEESNKNFHIGWTSDPVVTVTKASGKLLIKATGIPKFAKLFNESGEEINATWIQSPEGVSIFEINETPKKVFFEVRNDRDTLLLRTKEFSIAN